MSSAARARAAMPPAQRAARAADGTLLVAEVALTAVTLAAVIGLGRLFVDGSFLPPILLAAVASHTLAAGVRRLGWGIGLSSLVSFGGLVLFVAWVLYPETTTLALPTGATRDAAGADLSDAWLLFQDVVAPAPVEPGFVLASSAAVWAFAFSADWAAFRLLVGLEAVAPSATLFVFASVLGAPEHRVSATALYFAAVLFFLLVHRVLGDHASGTWLTSDPSKGVRALLRAGAGVAAISVLGGVVVGPGLPGADDAALIDWRDRGDDDGSRLTVSPLVDIRGRLVSQSDAEVFTVESEVRSYWRLTSLERFDGTIWSSQGRYRRAEGVLEGFDPDVEEVEGRQDFTIEALASPWLPAAFAPRAIDGGDSVRYEATSASLITEQDTSDGMQYAVLSAIPRFTPDELRTADGSVPDDIEDEYLDLPPSFDDGVRQLAFSIADPAPTPYDKALALQQFFRQNFEYDINVGAGHNRDAIAQFLARRTGYCEQFAGTYAAMARAIGIPARVAVGFTPGEIDRDGVYHVRGEHAHAWPEIYLERFGWVAFEPTPGRGAPGAEEYTGVPEQQADPNDAQGATTVATTTPTSVAGEVTPSTLQLPQDLDSTGGEFPGLEPKPSPWPGRLGRAALVVLAVAVLWAMVVPTARVVRRLRRRAAADTPSRRIEVAWEEASETLALVGVAVRPSETPTEYALRAAAATRVDRSTLLDLATALTTASYAAGEASEALVERATAAAEEIGQVVRAGLGRRRRIRAALDPKPLLPHRHRTLTLTRSEERLA